MATSTLDPDNIPEPDRRLGKGHGTVSLGPSDTSDIDSDTDAVGTGERATAGRDSDIDMGSDIDVDHVDYVNPHADPDFDDSGMPLPRARHPNRTQHRR